jgi:hypothetical protein
LNFLKGYLLSGIMLKLFDNCQVNVLIALTLFFLLQNLFSINASAQSQGELEVFGRIEQSYEPVGNGEIRIVHNGTIINTTRTNSRGRFSFSSAWKMNLLLNLRLRGW